MPRPRINIDPRQVEALTRLGSPASEVADLLGVSESAIRKRFKALLAKARAGRRMKLREYQWKLAREGNVTMLVFLGKVELGQGREIQEMQDRQIVRRMVNRGDV